MGRAGPRRPLLADMLLSLCPRVLSGCVPVLTSAPQKGSSRTGPGPPTDSTHLITSPKTHPKVLSFDSWARLGQDEGGRPHFPLHQEQKEDLDQGHRLHLAPRPCGLAPGCRAASGRTCRLLSGAAHEGRAGRGGVRKPCRTWLCLGPRPHLYLGAEGDTWAGPPDATLKGQS